LVTHRTAGNADVALLVKLNSDLVEDEQYPRRFSAEELTLLWERWLGSDYRAVLFENDNQVAAYALYRLDEEGSVYLRQFFVCRHCRRQGIGREAMRQLREHIWPSGRRIVLEVLLHNERGLRFWRAVGFEDYALMLQYNSG
jgi:ribosomal protein S18 acetylase RimI-like enzyme